MKIIKRILPILSITLIVIMISQLLYSELLEREEERCWRELKISTQSVKDAMITKFSDEVVKLHLMEKIMLDNDIFDETNVDKLYIETVQPATIFSRIDVLYPDGTLISNGKILSADEDFDFYSITAKGEYISHRKTDFLTGEKCVYYILPVMKNDQASAALIGVIDSENLTDIFQPVIYDGEADICIIDSDDGNYIMDSWHKGLGNAYDTPDRKRLKGYEDVDLKNAIKNLETGAVAFESKTTGRPIYMYFTPLDISDWQLSIFIDEAVIFKDLISLRKLLIFTGIAEAFFLFLYFLWNIRSIRQLEKSSAEIEKQNIELDSERKISDVLCRDYTAVYHADLANDTAALLKIDPHTNIANMPDIQIRRKFGYTEHIHSYCEQFVDDSAKKEFNRIMARENLLNELKHSSRHTYRYQSLPNPKGYEYFEVQALRINDNESEDENFNVMIAFHHIDDVVTAEQKYQIELEKRLESEQKQNELLIGISRIYHSIFRIDLQADTYEELFCCDENSHLMRSSGTASSELKHLCEHFVAPQHKEQMIQFFDISTAAERLKNETSVSAECMTMDGNWHHASFITKRHDENGKVTHILYVTRIISDEKHREERLISIVENANEANRAKTDFISKVAHDIRTPMNSIFGFLEIAEKDITDSAKVKYSLDKIRTSGEFLKDLVNDVLDISKMENGKIALRPEKMLFGEMLEEFAVSVKNSDYDKNHSFNIDIHNIIHNCIIADSLRIKQIYANVLSNAVKYTPNGGHIDFTVYQEEIPDSDKVRIVSVISDTGIGMSEEFMAKMFDKFERGTDTRINTVNGYGLGLSIVKQLTDLMNGNINVTSAPGKGTVFRIEIETAYTEDADASPLPSSDNKGDKTDIAENAAICAGMHILVAEDNELNQEVITELLNMYNITCECAGDGAVCVERFNQEKEGFFDAVLMDMQMPNMNGLEAAKAIRGLSLPWAKTIPIIAMTANAMKDDVRSCLDAGMNVHLSKPVDMNKLLSVLADFKRK